MTVRIHNSATAMRQPDARLNPDSFARGKLLVTVDIGEDGTWLAFESAAEVEPYVAAFTEALRLAREGEAGLSGRDGAL